MFVFWGFCGFVSYFLVFKFLSNCVFFGLFRFGSFVLDDFRRYFVDLRYIVFYITGFVFIFIVIINEVSGSRIILYVYRFVYLFVFC